jgi:hypothetical protein
MAQEVVAEVDYLAGFSVKQCKMLRLTKSGPLCRHFHQQTLLRFTNSPATQQPLAMDAASTVYMLLETKNEYSSLTPH